MAHVEIPPHVRTFLEDLLQYVERDDHSPEATEAILQQMNMDFNDLTNQRVTERLSGFRAWQFKRMQQRLTPLDKQMDFLRKHATDLQGAFTQAAAEYKLRLLPEEKRYVVEIRPQAGE